MAFTIGDLIWVEGEYQTPATDRLWRVMTLFVVQAWLESDPTLVLRSSEDPATGELVQHLLGRPLGEQRFVWLPVGICHHVGEPNTVLAEPKWRIIPAKVDIPEPPDPGPERPLEGPQ